MGLKHFESARIFRAVIGRRLAKAERGLPIFVRTVAERFLRETAEMSGKTV
jgi:hypothetical protein